MSTEATNATEKGQLSVGNYLKYLREQQGKTLAEVAKSIDRREEDLARIEADDFKSLVRESAAVYVQGAIRNFASSLQVPRKDIDALIKRFHQQMAHDEPVLVITEANIASQTRSLRRGHLVPVLRLVLPLLAFVVGASQLLNSDSWVKRKLREAFPVQGQMIERNAQGQEIMLSGESTVINAGDSMLLTVNPVAVNTANSSALTSSTSPALTLESAPEQSLTSQSTPLVAENTSESQSVLTTQSPILTLESTVTPVQDTPATALINPESTTTSQGETPLATSNTQGAQIRLEVLNDVWFEISNAQKKRVHTGTFKKGAVLELDASGAPYQLSLGKPSALKVEISGQQVSLSSLLMRGTKNQYSLKVE
ncbi:MAG: DUF4115 domain-containing protein [Cardiobacteriaceae bacterium]|nr:DUF4115 domain-containing protein [Cardiobacteriaceae bacterium]